MPLAFLSTVWSVPVNLYNRLHYYLAWWILLISAFQQRIHIFVAERFRQYGFFAARHPYSLILFSVVVFIITSYPLTEISFTEYPPVEYIASSLPVPAWFHGEESSLAILLPISVSLTFQPKIQSNKQRGQAADPLTRCSPIRTAALAADRLISSLYSSATLPVSYERSCFRLQNENNAKLSSDFLPDVGDCFLIAPRTSLNSVSQLAQFFDNLSSAAGVPSNMSLADKGVDLMFGVPFSATNLQSLYSNEHIKHMCTSARRHSVHFVAFAFFAPDAKNLSMRLTDELLSRYPTLHDELLHALSESETSDESMLSVDKLKFSQRPAFLYFRSWNWIEFTPMVAIYCALLGYIYFSLSKIAMVKSKVGLAFGAVFGIGASFLVVIGICTRLGLTFGYFFTITDVFPYVVVLNGLENIVIMTTAVTNCRRESKCDVPHCIAGGLEVEGFRMVKHVLLAAFVSVIGVLTGVPQIRDFFLMALIGLCTDLLFQLVFFSAVLAIDIKRIELDEKWMTHRRQRSGDASENAPNTSNSSLWPSWISAFRKKEENDEKLQVSNGFSLIEWFHSRRFSSLLSVFAILFITILYLESYQRGFYYQLLVAPITETWSTKVKPVVLPFSRTVQEEPTNSTNSNAVNSSLLELTSETSSASLASEWWRKLPRGHFQKLFTAAYGISLTHRYLTIMPPLELHAHVPLELVEIHKQSDAMSSTPIFPPSSQQTAGPNPDVLHEEPISSQVLVVILIVLSLSVIVNLSLLLYTCLRRRFRPNHQRRRPSTFSPFDLVMPQKSSHILRVSPVASLNTFVTAVSSGRWPVTSHEIVENRARAQSEFRNSVVVAHSTDGLLTVLDPETGETICQMKRAVNFPSSRNNSAQPDIVQHPSSVLPCWSLVINNGLIYVCGGTSAVDIYTLYQNDGGAVNMVLRAVYESTVSSVPVQKIICLSQKMIAVAFADGSIDVVHVSNNANTVPAETFSCVYTMRMRPPLVFSLSNNLFAVGSSDGSVRISLISCRQPSVSHCVTIYLPPLTSQTIPNSNSNMTPDEISAISINSNEPVKCAVGTTCGRIFIYELTPKSEMSSLQSEFSAAALATPVFSYLLPRSLPSSFSLTKTSTVSRQLVSSISKIAFDATTCIAVNAAGSVCVISCRRDTPVVAGTLHPNPGASLSLAMSPVLDVVVVPNQPSNGTSNISTSFFASSHSDGHVNLWAVRHQYPSTAGISLLCVATAQSPVTCWPVEQLSVLHQSADSATSNNVFQLIFSVRNKIYRIDIPLNVNYIN